MTINKLCVCVSLCHCLSIIHDTLVLPVPANFAFCCPAEGVVSKYNPYTCECVRERETHIPLVVPVWLFGVITEHRMVTLAKKGWNECFRPERGPICVQRLVYLTQDLSWLPLST